MEKYRISICYCLLLCALLSFAEDRFEFVIPVRDQVTKQPLSVIECYVYRRVKDPNTLKFKDLKEEIKEEIGPIKSRQGNLYFSLPERPEKHEYYLWVKTNQNMLVSPHVERPVDKIYYEDISFDLYIPENAKSGVELPPIYMKRERAKKLKEVEVTATATKIMFYHKGDTIVYNADAFLLADGSMLDALLDQMPGVELRGNGEIFCNGRKVQNLLLNGKDLFNGKIGLMLDNIAAYTIKDISFYNKSGRISELLMRNGEDTEYVMDVKLKKEYSHGFTVNADGGYGTEDRYLGKGFGLLFSDYFSISAVGGANNLSDSNKPGEKDNIWNPSGMSSGRFSRELGGLNYFVPGKDGKWEIKGDADITQNRVDKSSETAREYLLANGSKQFEYSSSKPIARNLQVTTNHEIFTKLGSRATMTITPNFTYNKSSSSRSEIRVIQSGELAEWPDVNLSKIQTISNSGEIITLYREDSESKGENISASVKIQSDIKLNSTINNARYIRATVSGNYANSKDDRYEKFKLSNNSIDSETSYKFSDRYYKNSPNSNSSVMAGAAYNQYCDAYNLFFTVGYDYRYSEKKKNSAAFQLDQLPDYDVTNLFGNTSYSGEFGEAYNPAQSYNSLYKEHKHRVSFKPRALHLTPFRNNTEAGKKSAGFSWAGDVGVDLDNKIINYFNNSTDRDFNKIEILPFATVNFSLNYPDKRNFQSYLDLKYRREGIDLNEYVSYPSSDPLHIVTGNSALKNSSRYGMSYSAYWHSSRVNNVLHAEYAYIDRPVRKLFSYDASTGIKTYQAINTKNRSEAKFKYDVSASLDKKRKFSLISNLSFNFIRQNDPEWIVHTYMTREELRLNWAHKKVRLTAFANALWIADCYSKAIDDMSQLNFRYGLEGVVKFPYDWSISTDLSIYTRRGYYSRELNTTDFIWNAKITKSILKGAIIFAADAYDILHQISNVTYKNDTQLRVESISHGVPAFFLFHVQFRLNKQPKK